MWLIHFSVSPTACDPLRKITVLFHLHTPSTDHSAWYLIGSDETFLGEKKREEKGKSEGNEGQGKEKKKKESSHAGLLKKYRSFVFEHNMIYR